MKPIRLALSIGGAVLLTLGYFASQVAYFQGDPSGYAARVDQPPVHLLAGLLFLAGMILSFMPEREGEKV